MTLQYSKPRWPSWLGHRLGKVQNEPIRWKEFRKWLLREYKRRIARQRLSYARKYADSLISRDLSELQSLSTDKRLHVMKALSALSSFSESMKIIRRFSRITV